MEIAFLLRPTEYEFFCEIDHLLPKGNFPVFPLDELEAISTASAYYLCDPDSNFAVVAIFGDIPIDVSGKAYINDDQFNDLPDSIRRQQTFESFGCDDRFFDIIGDLRAQLQSHLIRIMPLESVPAERVITVLEIAKTVDAMFTMFNRRPELDQPTRFFQNFREFTSGLSIEEVDQIVWRYLSYPGNIGDAPSDLSFPLEQRVRLIEAMVVPFREYLNPLSLKHTSKQNGFFMWWDIVIAHQKGIEVELFLEPLKEILYLSNPACQAAALHGLNHLQHPDRHLVIERWLEDENPEPEMREFAKICKSGKHM
jgi:hypothetical protein